MMYPAIRKLAVIAFFTCIVGSSMAQDPGGPKNKLSPAEKTETKPFRVLTNGNRSQFKATRILARSLSGRPAETDLLNNRI